MSTSGLFNKALAIAKPAQNSGLPWIISFVTDQHGQLLSGTPLKEAVDAILDNPAAADIEAQLLDRELDPYEAADRLLGDLA